MKIFPLGLPSPITTSKFSKLNKIPFTTPNMEKRDGGCSENGKSLFQPKQKLELPSSFTAAGLLCVKFTKCENKQHFDKNTIIEIDNNNNKFA